MVLFWPVQQELDCITDSGRILGKIRFGGSGDDYVFHPLDDTITLSDEEKMSIAARLAGLQSGKYTIPMQDDD